MIKLRTCENCNEHIPPETEHIESDNDGVYCMSCVEIVEYTEHQFLVNGDYIGDSGEGNCRVIEAYEDEYEESE